jgi:hypothetical protein
MRPATCIALILAFGLCHAADRGRPAISNAKLLTDKGTLLRGVRYGIDFGEALPPRAQVLSLSTTYGLNAVHLYLEKYDTPVGQNAAKADSLVAWTSQAGLYLVITIGCGTHNGQFDRTQATAFWNFYAPRYKDRTHVIYELQNEPQFVCNETYSDSTIQFEKDMYDLIRSKAPNTMILMFTFAGIEHASFALQDIRKLTNVSWSNAAVAYHGYTWCATAAQEKDSIGAVIRAGYAYINTEYADAGDWTVQTKLYEQMGIGWLNFQYVGGAGGSDMAAFKTQANAAELTWVPDFGTWPQAAVKVLPRERVQSPVTPGRATVTVQADRRRGATGLRITTGGSAVDAFGRQVQAATTTR